MKYFVAFLGVFALALCTSTPMLAQPAKDKCRVDGVCQGNETPEYCPEDCGGGAEVCGDGVCEGSETPDTCPEDCTSSPPPADEPDWEVELPRSPSENWDVEGSHESYSNYYDSSQGLFDFVESVGVPDYRALWGKKTTLVLQFRANSFGHDNPEDHWVRFFLPDLSSDSGATGCNFPDVSSGSPGCMVEFAAFKHPLQGESYDLYVRVGSDIRIERMKVGRLSTGILVFNIQYEGGDNVYDSLRCGCDVSIQRLSPTEWRTETSGSNLRCVEYDDQNNTILEAFNTEGEFKFTAVWRKLE